MTPIKGSNKQFRLRVKEERKRQHELYGERQHYDVEWLTLLVEEIGEIAEAIVQNKPEQMRKEMIQAAALIQTWWTNPCPPEVDKQ